MIAALLLTAALTAAQPKNVILFIGDGMSTPQRMTADEFARKTGRDGLAMNRLPHQATTRTCSADSLVTDSAAAATAIACGEKTCNGSIGVNAAKKRVLSSAAAAKAAGRKVGIVTTVTINHATPAGFYGHRANRGEGYGLGLDLLASGFDYFAGGGLDGHDDRRHAEYRGDIYALAKDAGYRLVRKDVAAFRALKPGSDRVWYVASDGCLPFAIDADAWKNVPTLAELTAKGLELLENDGGFFLMVEGGKVDWAGHANDAATNLREVLALDEAVRVALAYQKAHPDTLVVTTGDHETGGMSMGFAGTGYALYMDRLANQKCSADRVAEFVRESRPASFDGLKPFLSENFGFDFSGADAKKNPMALAKEEVRDLAAAFDAKDPARLVTVVKNVFSSRCGIGWTTVAHTALPVLTTAVGPGAERFSGFLDNTDISKIMKDLVGRSE